MRHVLLGFALIAALAQPTAKAEARADRRIAQREYNPDQVVTIAGHRGVQTMIELSADETIENIALGDSAAWQVTPNKRANLVFVKPLVMHARTNMTVVTDQRRYLFELYQGSDRAPVLYSLRFTYPLEQERQPPPAPPFVVEAPASPAASPPTAINRDWHASGDARLIPAAIHDDGVSTYIAWSPDAEIPAILTQGPDGSEGAVNFTVKGDTLVVDGVAPRYILHLGKASAVLINGAPRQQQRARQEGAQ